MMPPRENTETDMAAKRSSRPTSTRRVGSHEFKLRDILLLSVGLSLLVYGVFIYGLSMTIPVWPAFMRD